MVAHVVMWIAGDEATEQAGRIPHVRDAGAGNQLDAAPAISALKESPAPVESAVMARLAVAAFGRRLAPDTTDAVTATRFLRSKGLRRIQSIDEVDALAQAAVQMYQASLAWRQAVRVDEILEEPPHSPEVEEVFQSYFNLGCLTD